LATSFAKNRLRFSLKSIRFRIAALFVGFFTLSLFALSAAVYGEYNAAQKNEFDRSLYNYAVDVAQGINVNVYGDLSVDIETFIGKGKSFPFAVGRSFFQLVRMDGRVISKSRDLGEAALPLAPKTLHDVVQNGFAFENLPDGAIPTVSKGAKPHFRLISLLVAPGTVPNFILQIAAPLTFIEQERKHLIELFSFIIPLALIVSLLGGIYFSGRALVPLQVIIEKAQALSPAQLDERLPLPPADDELRALSVTLNEMLERLQKMFQTQERFVADASHQLKTPLAILRGELDISLQKTRSPEEHVTLMRSLSQELLHLSKTVDDLLILARVGSGAPSLSKRPVRIDEVAMEAVARLEKLARERGISLKLDLEEAQSGDSSFVVEGDEDLLKSMISEIIDNAIKYSDSSLPVEIKVTDEKDFSSVEVADYGSGVPEKERDKIFEPFFRANKRDVAGSGLGLSIAKKIADIHGGELTYQPRLPRGSVFRLRIKKV
jgi:signal transduction histidine kinase